MEKSQLISKLSKYKKDLKEKMNTKKKSRKYLISKTLKVSMNRFNKIWNKKRRITNNHL